MIFIIATVLLLLELLYIKIAKAKNITDTPNHRSAHTVPTIRGGGIVFIIGILLYAVFYPVTKAHLLFITGAFLVAVISFVDDIITLSSKIRIFIHLLAFGLMFYGLQLFNIDSVYALVFLLLVSVLSLGFLNIYNFMDGINGITFLNALAVYTALLYINEFVIGFVESELLIILILAAIVFGFFNFRKKAICFAGDIGSITVGFSIIYFIIKLYVVTNSLLVFLLIAVYLLDGGWTIIERLFRKENILKAHKRHLYQLLANNFKYPHLVISSVYFIAQMFLSAIAIVFLLKKEPNNALAIVVFFLASIIYVLIKRMVLKKINKKH